jgi:hypothetical protein
MTSTYLNSTSMVPPDFASKTQTLLDFQALVAQLNTNSAALTATAGVNISVAQSAVEQDYLALQKWANQFFTLSQQQNGATVLTGFNVIVTLSYNPANVATTPVTMTMTTGNVPVNDPAYGIDSTYVH